MSCSFPCGRPRGGSLALLLFVSWSFSSYGWREQEGTKGSVRLGRMRSTADPHTVLSPTISHSCVILAAISWTCLSRPTHQKWPFFFLFLSRLSNVPTLVALLRGGYVRITGTDTGIAPSPSRPSSLSVADANDAPRGFYPGPGSTLCLASPPYSRSFTLSPTLDMQTAPLSSTFGPSIRPPGTPLALSGTFDWPLTLSSLSRLPWPCVTCGSAFALLVYLPPV